MISPPPESEIVSTGSRYTYRKVSDGCVFGWKREKEEEGEGGREGGREEYVL